MVGDGKVHELPVRPVAGRKHGVVVDDAMVSLIDASCGYPFAPLRSASLLNLAVVSRDQVGRLPILGS